MSERLYQLKDAAQRLGISTSTLRRRIKSGEVTAVRVDYVRNANAPLGVLRVPESALTELIERNT